MEHVESTTTAEVMDGMVIDPQENTAQENEIPAEVVAEELLGGDGEETQEKPAAAPAKDEKPEGDRKAAVEEGIKALAQQEWTGEELMTFSQDPQARKDIASGMSVADAAMRYLRRALAGAVKPSQVETETEEEAEIEAPEGGKKHGVPTIKRGAAANVRESTSIEDMDDEAFAKFSKRAQDLARMGKKVRIK